LTPGDDRITRSPKPQDGVTTRLLQLRLAAPHRVAEGVGSELGDTPMVPAVRRDLVPRCGDLPHHAAVALRQPPEHEEGPAPAVAGEQLEQPPDARLHATGNGAPLLARHIWFERRDLEILLDVDAEVVRDHRPPGDGQ